MTRQKETTRAGSALLDALSRLDADLVGIASLAEWRGTQLEETALALLPEAQSVVVVARETLREILDLTSPTRIQGAASTTDLVNADSAHISGRLTWAAYDVSQAAHSLGFRALPLPAEDCPMDNRFMQAVFSYKHAAQAAGLGKLGWHSLVITPEYGPRVRLGVCLTEVELPPGGESTVSFNCERCRKCVDICPAGAIREPSPEETYRIDKFACNTYRTAAGGCSECMRICPPGRKTRRARNV